MRVQEILERLQGVRRVGQGWKALCPAHRERHRASVSGSSIERWS